MTVRNGDVILDVGANVGLFALSLMQRFRGLTMVCIEPVPDIRACLERNLAESPWRQDHRITVLASAVGATNAEATISFLPRMPSNSTINLGDKRDEWKTIVDEITFSQIWTRNKLLALLHPLTFPFRRQVFARFVAPRLAEAVTSRCAVRTISDIMRSYGLDRVDVLKIDVEGAELGVLEGIEEQHWPPIQQLAMEIEARHKRSLSALTDRLRGLGFAKIIVESESGTPVLEDPMPCMLYAVRAPL